MTRDDITRMAREAGFNVEQGYLLRITGIDEDLERFAALVAAAEREKVAAWMMQRSYATGHGDTTEDLLKELEWQIAENWIKALVKGVEGEREACAKAAEEYMRECEGASFGIGEAIRARGGNT
jgi:hypothetical protein